MNARTNQNKKWPKSTNNKKPKPPAPATSDGTSSSSQLGCILPDFLYLAPVSATGNVKLLQREGITHVVSIGKNPMARIDGITYHKFGLLDNEQANLRAVVDQLCAVLDVLVPQAEHRTPQQRSRHHDQSEMEKGGRDEDQVESLPDQADTGFGVSSEQGPAVGKDSEAAGRLTPKNEPQPQSEATAKAKVLVHCSAAISRSPAVVVGYLIRRRGLTLRESLEVLVRARYAVSPNVGFLRQLRDLEREVFGLAEGEKSSFDFESLGGGRKLAKLLGIP